MNNVRVSFDGGIYEFSKDTKGVGLWYCVSGKNPGGLGKFVSGMTVPRALANQLSQEAIKLKLATGEDFSRIVKKEQKQKTNLKTKQKTESSFSKKGFNPFEDHLKSAVELEAEQKLENLKKNRKKKVIEEEETTGYFAEIFASDELEEMDTDADTEDTEYEEIEPEII